MNFSAPSWALWELMAVVNTTEHQHQGVPGGVQRTRFKGQSSDHMVSGRIAGVLYTDGLGSFSMERTQGMMEGEWLTWRRV